MCPDGEKAGTLLPSCLFMTLGLLPKVRRLLQTDFVRKTFKGRAGVMESLLGRHMDVYEITKEE